MSSGISERFHRLVEIGDLLVLRTDQRLRIVEVFGNTSRILGVTAEEMKRDPSAWKRFLDPHSMRGLRLRLRSASLAEELSAEVKVFNRERNETRWLLVRGVPLLSSEGSFLGWEGFGLDITEKHRAQEDLVVERRRLQALYEVSRSLKGVDEPAVIALRGLKALVKATNSSSGIVCFCDESTGSIELVAAEGLSEASVREIDRVVERKSLVRCVIESKAGILVDDMNAETRAGAPKMIRQERIRSGIISPVLQGGAVCAVVALFSRRRARYTPADLDLVGAALRNLGLALREAEMFANERQQAATMATLYQLTHELSRLMTAREMAAHAFPIIQGELACKRLWLGMLSDQGRHLVGQAGYGPGIRRSVTDLQIDLSERHDFLDAALRSREPIVVPAGAPMECSTLNRLRDRLALGTLIIVPLVSIGHVVGVLVLEPTVSSPTIAYRKLSLLTKMAGEIATVMLARRFESKMAEADKMRMAGMLASGVAHNFNNLLQAVMGQASLIEMQLPPNSPLRASTKMITESASKGASLIKQMMSFSMQGGSVRRTVGVNSLIKSSAELYESLLGSRVKLELSLAETCPPVYADQGQLQQVITNLVMNARDAVVDRPHARVVISTTELRVRPGEIDPELSPGIYLRLDVEDNGVGMDPERAARCFEPFYTTKNLDSRTGLGLTGAGLGLSSAYSIVKQHEGLISVRSRPEEGTVFSVYLPALTVRAEEGRPAMQQRDSRGAIVVLNCEGPLVRSITEAAERFKYEVQEARRLDELTQERSGNGSLFAVVNLARLQGASRESLRAALTTFSEQHGAIFLVTDGLESVAGLEEIPKVYGVERRQLIARLVSAIEDADRSVETQQQPLTVGHGELV